MRRRAKAIVKFGLARVAPSLTLTLLSIRSRRFIERQARDLGLAEFARRLAAAGSIVQSGPFAGMRLDVEALPVHVAPKLLGTYENELHPAIEAAISGKPEVVLNVGCAEGYYAVGLALRLPEATVHAFDADPKARRATARNAAINSVGDRVHTAGAIRAESLEPFLRLGRALVVMDCEGAEVRLLDPLLAPSLITAHIVVEVHPNEAAEAAATITERFAATHAVERLEPAELKAKIITAPPVLSAPELRIAVDERRGHGIFWLVLIPARQAVDDNCSHPASPRHRMGST
jgi:precorrin-6B methylase 2